jgi:hypothetical protein
VRVIVPMPVIMAVIVARRRGGRRRSRRRARDRGVTVIVGVRMIRVVVVVV